MSLHDTRFTPASLIDVYWAPTMGKAQTREPWAGQGQASPPGASSVAGETHRRKETQAGGGEPCA